MRLKAILLFLWVILSPVPAFADSITIPNTFSAGTSAQASQVNANFTAVTTVVNGNLDNANIKAAAGIVPSKLSLISEYLNLQTTDNRGFSAGVTGDTVPRVALNSRGSLDFGPGSSTAMDLAIIRSDANTLALRDRANSADKNFTVGALTFSGTSAGTALLSVLRSTNNNCVAAGVTGDTVPRVALNSRGSIDFGAGSSSAMDLAITREDANTAAVRNQADNAYKNFKAAGIVLTATPLPFGSGGTGTNAPGSALQPVRINASGTALEGYAPTASFSVGTQSGRLTGTTATAVTTSDVVGSTSVYFTPYRGNQIPLYNGSSWVLCTFSEITGSLSGLTANLLYDVFVYDANSDGVADTLDLTAWTNTTTRATALTTQDGVLVKTGATGRRYIGTIRINATGGQVDDRTADRGVYNHYNKVKRSLRCVDTTDSWTYSSATFRPFNNMGSTLGTGSVMCVVGVAEDLSRWIAQGEYYYTASRLKVGIGVDSTSSNSAQLLNATDNNTTAGHSMCSAILDTVLSAGSHQIYPLEATQTGTTSTTMYGDNGGVSQHGMIGELLMFAPKKNVVPFQKKVEDFGYENVA